MNKIILDNWQKKETLIGLQHIRYSMLDNSVVAKIIETKEFDQTSQNTLYMAYIYRNPSASKLKGIYEARISDYDIDKLKLKTDVTLSNMGYEIKNLGI